MGKRTLKSAIIDLVSSEKYLSKFTSLDVYTSLKEEFPKTSIASVHSYFTKANCIVPTGDFTYGRRKIFFYRADLYTINSGGVKKIKKQPPGTEMLSPLQIGEGVIHLLNEKDKEIRDCKKQIDALREQLKGERANHKATERNLRNKLEAVKNEVSGKGFPLSEVARVIKKGGDI